MEDRQRDYNEKAFNSASAAAIENAEAFRLATAAKTVAEAGKAKVDKEVTAATTKVTKLTTQFNASGNDQALFAALQVAKSELNNLYAGVRTVAAILAEETASYNAAMTANNTAIANLTAATAAKEASVRKQ